MLNVYVYDVQPMIIVRIYMFTQFVQNRNDKSNDVDVAPAERWRKFQARQRPSELEC